MMIYNFTSKRKYTHPHKAIENNSNMILTPRNPSCWSHWFPTMFLCCGCCCCCCCGCCGGGGGGGCCCYYYYCYWVWESWEKRRENYSKGSDKRWKRFLQRNRVHHDDEHNCDCWIEKKVECFLLHGSSPMSCWQSGMHGCCWMMFDFSLWAHLCLFVRHEWTFEHWVNVWWEVKSLRGRVWTLHFLVHNNRRMCNDRRRNFSFYINHSMPLLTC